MTVETKGNVLIVDDDAAGRLMLGLSLRLAGFTVVTASDGMEALALLKDPLRRFDWLVTDAKMAPMDGFDLTRRAKALQPGLHVVLMSAVYTEEDIRGAPVDAFLPKPFDPKRLAELMAVDPAR